MEYFGGLALEQCDVNGDNGMVLPLSILVVNISL